MSNIPFPFTFKGLEFATFRLKTGADEAGLLSAAKTMEDEFLNKEDGFLGHAVLKGDNGTYVDLVFAVSQTKAEELCSKWMQNPFALQFLEFIDPTSTNMSFWTRL